jgi:hypothetical protein
MPNIDHVKFKRMLHSAKEMSAVGIISGHTAFFLIAAPILKLAQQFEELAACPKLMFLDGKMKALEERLGQRPLPQEWHDLECEWNRILDKIIVGKFIECGEPGMAALYESDRCEFYRRYENGRRLTSQCRDN